MAKQRPIHVHGKPRPNIDATVLVQVLLAIADDLASEKDDSVALDTPDVHLAAIEDRAASNKRRAG